MTLLPPALKTILNPATRAKGLQNLFGQLNPKKPCPLPEHLLATLPHKTHSRLACLNPFPLLNSLTHHQIENQLGSQSTVLIPPHITAQELLPACENLFEALLSENQTLLLQKIPVENQADINPSLRVALHKTARDIEAKLLDEHPAWLLKKGHVTTICFNPTLRDITFPEVQTLPPLCSTRMPTFPLFFKRGANKVSALVNTHTGQVLEEAFSGTPQGQKILAKTCAEATRLGLLGIPTWIS